MARGNSGKRPRRGRAWAALAVVLAASLGVAMLVAATTRSCDALREEAARPEPLTGLPIETLGPLGWRDCVTTDDPRRELNARLSGRGYVRRPAPRRARPRRLPTTVRSSQLAGACGLVLASSVGPGTLAGARVGSEERALCAERAVAVAVCGDQRIHLRGAGQVEVEVWVMPGLTEEDGARAGMPVDVALAHAEAETLLAARGFRPSAQVLRQPVPAGGWVELASRPDVGCVAWVIVSVPEASGVRPLGLAGGSSCQGAPERSRVYLDALGEAPGEAFSRPYEASAGPLLAADAPDALTLPGVTLVDDPAAMELPEPLASSVPPP